MNPDRFRQIKELFEKVLEQKPEERDRFLEAACAHDLPLRQEVASLLVAHDKKDTFLETSPRDAEPDQPVPGNLIGPYRIQREIGRGGMGVVYLAEDTRLQRLVALKALPPDLVIDEKRKERLRLEARTAASLSHPAIATVYALEEFNGHLYIASEYVQGRDLHDHLEESPLSPKALLDVAVEIAKGLVAAHAKGVVHRDLKPGNVVLTEQGEIKIVDFGLALLSETEESGQRLTQAGTLLGTPAYMAPEQLESGTVDFRCDIFAFGTLLYELASGTNPFEGKTPISTIARILQVDPEPVSSLTWQAPELDRIIEKCLRKSPKQRYQSTQELLADLERLRDDRTKASKRTPSKVPNGDEKRTERNPLALWWTVHQTSVIALYGLMGLAAWKVKESNAGKWSVLLFFGILICGALNGTLRTHLLFTSRFNRRAMNRQLQGSFPWIRRCDWVFVSLLLAAAVAVSADHHVVAGLLAGVAIAYLVVFLVVEPATAGAAFGGEHGPETSVLSQK